MTPDEFLRALHKALGAYEFRDAEALIDEMNPTDFNDTQAKLALSEIRRKRLFPLLEKAAGLFLHCRPSLPIMRRQLAQALLDQNRITQAIAILEPMLGAVKDDPREGPEVRGLIGRAYKQRFINEGVRADLPRAIAAYQEDWEVGGHLWHGINLVALLKRAQRETIATATSIDPDEIARTILGRIEATEEREVWDAGTAMEAAVALDDWKEARRWVKAYATDPAADAFELNSTLRQLKEVWQLEGQDLGDLLLPVLEYEALQRSDSSIPIGRAIATVEGFQSVYGDEGMQTIEWMQNMLERCRSIARISDPETGKAYGTGFLLKGSELRQDWGDAPVLLSNSHVISKNPADEAPLRPEQGRAEFTYLEGRPKVQLGGELYSSPKYQLDVCVQALEAPGNSEPLKTTIHQPTKLKDNKKQRIYVIGHPNGRELEVSLYDNDLAHYEGGYVRYRSPTEGGNSGSPVFNRRLKAFAIHHRTVSELEVNEGVLFEPIFASIRS